MSPIQLAEREKTNMILRMNTSDPGIIWPQHCQHRTPSGEFISFSLTDVGYVDTMKIKKCVPAHARPNSVNAVTLATPNVQNLQFWDASSPPLINPCKGLMNMKWTVPGLLSKYSMQSETFDSVNNVVRRFTERARAALRRAQGYR